MSFEYCRLDTDTQGSFFNFYGLVVTEYENKSSRGVTELESFKQFYQKISSLEIRD